MPFADLFGLDPAVRALQRSLAGDQLAGAYLFVGPAGCGKTTLARAFAQAAACTSPGMEPFDACGKCESCVRLAAGTHPEIVQIAPAGDQTQIWQFWDRDNRPQGALQHSLPYAPSIGRRRVYIIERADTLNEAAANSLLKVLEEPPSYALFVLLSPHAARMLPTILSRTQMVRVVPPAVEETARYLQTVHGVPSADAARFAAYSGGKVGAALRLAHDKAALAEIDAVLDFAQTIPLGAPLRALKVAEGVRKLASGMKALVGNDSAENSTDGEAPATKEKVGRKQLGLVIELLAAYYEDVLAAALAGEAAHIVHSDRRAAITTAGARGEPARWTACLEALLTARRRVDQNASIPLLTDWLAVKLSG